MKNFQQNSEVKSWVRLHRSDDLMELIRLNPLAYALATIIAVRARWREGFNQFGLDQGEAMLGDFENYGMTEKEYRVAKKNLEKWNIAAFRRTNKGTIARLIDSRIFSIFDERQGEPKGGQGAITGRTEGGQGATNQNLNTDKTDKNVTGGTRNDPVAFKKFTEPSRENVRAWVKFCFKAASADDVELYTGTYFDKFNGNGWKDKHGKPIEDWKPHCKKYAEGIRKNLMRIKR